MIKWQTIKNYNFLGMSLIPPLYNITVKSKDIILQEVLNTKDYVYTEEKGFLDDLNIKKPKFYSQENQNAIEHTYTFHFIKNYEIYKKNYNKLGFFKNLEFIIDYVNTPDVDYQFDIQYCEIENLDKDLLLNKIYKSNDSLSLKLLIDTEYFKEKEVCSILILSPIGDKYFENILVENINEKWLDSNEKKALLTVPFGEDQRLKSYDKLCIEIIPLNMPQTEIYNFLKSREPQIKINEMFKDFFPNQVFAVENLEKQIENNDTLIMYQNYLYLFNKDSLPTNASNIAEINKVKFYNYYPLLNKNNNNNNNNNNKTICINCDTEEDVNDLSNFDKDYLGYFYKDLNSYRDANSDFSTLINNNILQVKILQIEESENLCDIYVEFVTKFYDNEKFYIETSNNLKFYEKYNTQIDGRSYITFLFKYSYDLSILNKYLIETNQNNRSQIIYEKNIINFTGKIIL